MEEKKQEAPKEEPKHYGMELAPGKYVVKLFPEPEKKDDQSKLDN